VGNINARYLQFFQAVVYTFLVINVEIGSALIDKEDSWLSIEGSRKHHSLFLPA
jgi:hypothetical protein